MSDKSICVLEAAKAQTIEGSARLVNDSLLSMLFQVSVYRTVESVKLWPFIVVAFSLVCLHIHVAAHVFLLSYIVYPHKIPHQGEGSGCWLFLNPALLAGEGHTHFLCAGHSPFHMLLTFEVTCNMQHQSHIQYTKNCATVWLHGSQLQPCSNHVACKLAGSVCGCVLDVCSTEVATYCQAHKQGFCKGSSCRYVHELQCIVTWLL